MKENERIVNDVVMNELDYLVQQIEKGAGNDLSYLEKLKDELNEAARSINRALVAVNFHKDKSLLKVNEPVFINYANQPAK